jgi:hypothetical protein
MAYRDVILADKPVFYWRLGETSGTAAADSSVSGYPGTYVGAPSLGTGGALANDADGAVGLTRASTQYVERVAAMPILPSGAAARSLEAWIYPLDTTGGAILAYGAASAGAGQSFILQMSGPSPMYLFTDGVNAGNNITITGSQIPPVNVWSHIVFTMTAAGAWVYYLNAVQALTGTFGTAINTVVTRARVGQRSDWDAPSTGNSALYNGRIDEAAIYPVVLTPQQVLDHYRVGVVGRFPVAPYAATVLADGPVGYWRLNDLGTTLLDSSPTALTGTLTGLPMSQRRVPGPLGYTDPDSGSLSFVGNAAHYGSVPGSAALDLQTLTVEAWAMPSGSQNGFIFEKTTTGAVNTEYSLFLSGTNVIFRTVSGGTSYDLTWAIDTTILIYSAWNHLAATWDGVTKRLYVNGRLVASTAFSGLLDTNPTGTSWIGVYGNAAGYPFSGRLAEVAVYPKALSADRVAAHWEMGNLANVTPPYQRAVLNDGPSLYLSMRERGFDPNSVSGLIGWLKPEAITGYAAGAALTASVANQGSNATPWTLQGSPIYQTGGFGNLPYIQQAITGSTGLRWAVDLSATVSTIFVKARQRVGGASGLRILAGLSNNWLLGWHGGREDLAYFAGWAYGLDTATTNYGYHPDVAGTTNVRVYAGVSGPGGISEVYRDGRLVASNGAGTAGPNGLATNGHNGVSEFSDSDLYEVLVYNRRLTPQEIAAVNSYLAVNDKEIRNSGLDAVHAGATTGFGPGPLNDPLSRSLVLTGGSFTLDPGTSGVAQVAGPSTWECWIYPTTQGDAARRSVFQKTTYTNEMAMLYESNGTLTAVWGDGTNYVSLTSTVSIPINAWSHMAFVRGASAATTFWVVNGIVLAPMTGTFYTGVAGTGPFTLGSGYQSNFLGRIAELAVYRRPLTAAQIIGHYRAGLTPHLASAGFGYGS